jgi:hypothetical protein
VPDPSRYHLFPAFMHWQPPTALLVPSIAHRRTRSLFRHPLLPSLASLSRKAIHTRAFGPTGQSESFAITPEQRLAMALLK